MSYTKSKHFIKRQLSEESSLGFTQSDFERDDDDPFIRSLSITSLGIIFAFLKFLLPSIIFLIGRPYFQGKEVIFNHDFKKDGS